MKKRLLIAFLVVILFGAAAYSGALLQGRFSGLLVGGLTATGNTNAALLVDSDGTLHTTGTSAAGNLTNNNAAPAANNGGVLPNVANASDPSWTEGNMVVGSVNLQGYQRVVPPADVYHTALPSLTNGQTASFQYTSNSALLIAGVSYLSFVATSVGGTVVTSALTTAGFVGGGQCTNDDPTLWAYVKFFDTTGTVQIGTSPIAAEYGLPPNGGSLTAIVPMRITNGLKLAGVTTGGTNGHINCTILYLPQP